MKRTAAFVTVALVIGLTGCASASPDETAWKQCIAFYDEHEPNGTVSADNGETYDSERTCHNMIGHRGQDEFTAFWNDPDRVADYARGF